MQTLEPTKAPPLPAAREPAWAPRPQLVREPGGNPKLARRLWLTGIGMLAGAILVVVSVVGMLVLPPTVDVIGAGLGATTGAVGDGAAAVADAWENTTSRLEATAVAAAERPAEPLPLIAEGSGALLVIVTDAAGDGVAFALFSHAPEGEATVVLVPPSLLGIIPGYGDFPLATSLRFEGPELAGLTLTNLLGVRVDEVVALGPGDLAAALGSPVPVDLPNPLVVADGEQGRVLAKSGRAERVPAAAETILVTRGTGDSLAWLQRQGAIWEGVLTLVAADPEVATNLAGSPAGAAILGTVATAEDRTMTAVPVARVSIGGPDAGFALAGEAADEFVAQRLAHLHVRAGGDRPRVEVLNGNGRVGTTQIVAQRLVERGYEIIKTDNAIDFGYEETQVIAQGRDNRVEAEHVAEFLGTGELLLELRAPSGVVDISIIVGADVPVGEG